MDISHYCSSQHLIAHRDHQGKGRVFCPLFFIINFCVIVRGCGPLRHCCFSQIASTLVSRNTLSMLSYGMEVAVMKSASAIGLADKDRTWPCRITCRPVSSRDDMMINIHTVTLPTYYPRHSCFFIIKMYFSGVKMSHFFSYISLFYSLPG